MRPGTIPTSLILLVLLAAGCVDSDPGSLKVNPRGGGSDQSRQIDQLKRELDTVKSRNLIITSRLEEQLARERRLADRVNKLKFLNSQQRMQIETLAYAPIQRDANLEKVKQLTQQVDQLQRRIEQLKATIAEAQDKQEQEPQSDPSARVTIDSQLQPR